MAAPSRAARRRSLKSLAPYDPRLWIHRASLTINRAVAQFPGSTRYYESLVDRQLHCTELDWERLGGPALGLRVAFLSDLHAGSFIEAESLSRIFERVQLVEPDLVIIGGDLINSRRREVTMVQAAAPVLSPQLGVYVVPGNHEWYAGLVGRDWRDFVRGLGWVDLTNRGERISTEQGSFWLAGIDDIREGQPDLDRALAGREEAEFCLLVSHNPDVFPSAAAREVGLTLSGHTHGGQIRLAGRAWLTSTELRYASGEYCHDEHPGSRLYVSRGIGASLLPVRVDCSPEWTLFS